MSFDLFFFRLRPNASLDEVDACFSEQSEEPEDDKGEGDENPETPIDPTLTREELSRRVARPLLSIIIPENERSRELQELLAKSSDQDMDDKELLSIEEVESYLEWMNIGIRGVWMMGIAYGADFDLLSKAIGNTMTATAPHRIHIFDPQQGKCLSLRETGEADME